MFIGSEAQTDHAAGKEHLRQLHQNFKENVAKLSEYITILGKEKPSYVYY